MTWRERAVAGVCLVGALAVLFMVGRVAGASAAPVPTDWQPCTSAVDPATCQRVDFMASEASQLDAESSGLIERLDLVWIGVWFSGGVLLGVTFAQKIWAEVRKWHGGWR